MEILLSHKSALEYWRIHGRAHGDSKQRLRRRKAPAETPRLKDVSSLKSLGLSLPLDVIVSTPATRRRSKKVRPHLFSGMLEEGCINKIGDGLYVCSPEFCFFQMAGELHYYKLIELGFELCGRYLLLVPGYDYADPEITKRGFRNLEGSLTSKKRLKAFLERMAGALGQRPLLRAIRYVADGSASPVETILAMFLTLPYKYGGYGLPLPQLNPPNDSAQSGKQGSYHRSSNKNRFRSDLTWPGTDILVEYDSEMFHSGSAELTKDSMRRNVLTISGKRTITVTKSHVFSVLEFDTVAKQIAKGLGKRLRDERNKEFPKERIVLRTILLERYRGG